MVIEHTKLSDIVKLYNIVLLVQSYNSIFICETKVKCLDYIISIIDRTIKLILYYTEVIIFNCVLY